MIIEEQKKKKGTKKKNKVNIVSVYSQISKFFSIPNKNTEKKNRRFEMNRKVLMKILFCCK